MSNLMNDISTSTIDLSNSSFKYDGEQATKGYLTYDAKGNVTGKMYISGYCIEITSDGSITSEKLDEDDCSIKQLNPEETKTYANGEVVYFNVTTGTKCTDYTESQSATGVKSGCMKFYAFNDDGSDTINLLLDHNTTANVAWNLLSNDTKSGPKEVLEQLKTDTSSWSGTITPNNYSMDQSDQPSESKYEVDYSSYKARLITAQEIAKVTGNTTFDERTSALYYFFFDTNTDTESATCKEGNTSGCKYGWLYDRTATDCTTYGCLNNSDSLMPIYVYGYWTISTSSFLPGCAWYVDSDGSLDTNLQVSNDSFNGVRPVITVLKSKLS